MRQRESTTSKLSLPWLSAGVLAAIILAAAFAYVPQSLQLGEADVSVRIAAIEKEFDARRVELRVPGAALVIVMEDRVIMCRGFGLRDVERDLPVTPDTLFAIGSCTKAFTGLAAVISAEDGKQYLHR